MKNIMKYNAHSAAMTMIGRQAVNMLKDRRREGENVIKFDGVGEGK